MSHILYAASEKKTLIFPLSLAERGNFVKRSASSKPERVVQVIPLPEAIPSLIRQPYTERVVTEKGEYYR